MADKVARDVLGMPLRAGYGTSGAGAVAGYPDPLGGSGLPDAPAETTQGALAPPREDAIQGEYPTIIELLKEVQRFGASDLHLTAGAPPHLRIDGEFPFRKSSDRNDQIRPRLSHDHPT